jgi:iron complex outermembrane receptor protein
VVINVSSRSGWPYRKPTYGTLTAASIALAALAKLSVALAEVSSATELTQMSLSDLASVEVTSVSKSSESLSHAPAAIYVITHEDIIRSGAASVPEVLRLAPNLLVTQTSSSAYIIAARGFGGNPVAQNFSDKLLILIDGRSVYTPLFSGIYANTLDVMLEDIDRIEVISGVGATLWGANAMNGVINIITRPSYLTQGAFVDALAGNQDQSAAARYGTRLSDDTTARFYGFEFHRGAMELSDGSTARDGWSKGQGGFRGDWSMDRDTVTVQGDFYRGSENELGGADGLLLGGNIVTRYQHHGTASDIQVQAYVDQTEQFGSEGETGFVVHTYDLSLQQSLATGAHNQLIWGGGERVYSYGITNTASLMFEPPTHGLTLANVFLQDTAALAASLDFVAGIKMEDDPFSGWVGLPDARLAWSFDERSTLWLAASRAIRSPTPFDDEVVEKIGALTYLAANTQFRPERVTAYETGVRSQPAPNFSFAVAPFYNVYDNLKTVDPNLVTGFLPLYWGNSLRGDTYGLDAWASWQVSDWWRLSPGATWVRERLEFKAGAIPLLGASQAGDDPSSHASITSSMNLPQRTSLDTMLRYVGALASPGQQYSGLPAYCELDARVGWRAAEGLDLSLSGTNLLHPRHLEYPVPYGEEITRAAFAEVRWRF